ncbi:hypothetical protein [Plebeiibacterium sediminum]|uniref:Uncharacterized protein n=1 Tax=Plebeiibacterium sediminum TaxID=2992112 RepID=A0AAE3M3T8_9BACT|nr:hypothetical protein [Plebeiobacterium sediminum]MCW3786297.1 hypothetical protein [Plebeiobacterium sediminum]
MLKSKHCGICENQISDKRTGTKCGITNEKPQFKNKCDKISFDKKYEKIILDTNIELETISRKKAKTYSTTFVLLAISIVIMLLGFLLGIFAFEGGVISTLPLIIIGVGFLVIPKALHPFVMFKQTLSVAKNKKDELDNLLSLYNVKYDLDLNFKEDRHGNLDVTPNVIFTRKYYR